MKMTWGECKESIDKALDGLGYKEDIEIDLIDVSIQENISEDKYEVIVIEGLEGKISIFINAD